MSNVQNLYPVNVNGAVVMMSLEDAVARIGIVRIPAGVTYYDAGDMLRAEKFGAIGFAPSHIKRGAEFVEAGAVLGGAEGALARARVARDMYEIGMSLALESGDRAAYRSAQRNYKAAQINVDNGHNEVIRATVLLNSAERAYDKAMDNLAAIESAPRRFVV